MNRRDLLALLFCFCATPALAIDVFVDFTSDFHDGDSSDNFVGNSEFATPDGVPDWIQELNQGTQAAGVPDFTGAERQQIQDIILSELNRVFEGTTLNFVTEQPPASDYEVIYFGRDADSPEVSSTNRGSATVDVGNRFTRPYTSVGSDPSGVARVTPSNAAAFDIEASDSRADQIDEFSISIASTAAHELGHTFGLMHQFAFSAPGITPSNYNDTGSLQNDFIIATGDTGISETERQTPRTLSPFSRVVLDIAGGSNPLFGGVDNDAVAPGGAVVSNRTEFAGLGPGASRPNANNLGTDAGDTIATAQPLSFSTGELSGQEISFVEADLDGSVTDVDLFSFSTAVDALLTVNVFSESLSFGSDEFDPTLQLLDASGSLIFEVTNTSFDDDDFVDFESPEAVEVDPFLPNVPLPAGDYFLRVSADLGSEEEFASVGDLYYLVAALTLDESSLLAGDYNGDGRVNAGDYVAARDTLGSGVDLRFSGADGNGDGVVDADDFAVLFNNFSAGVSPSPASVAAPEPATLGLAIITFGVVSRRHRIKR